MRRTLKLVLLFLFTINIGCTHTPTKKLSTDKVTENTQAIDDKQSSSEAKNVSDTTHALADPDNKTVEETPTPADTSPQAATYPKPTPASFSGSPKKYCALRQLHIVNMVNNRDRGIKRGQIHKIISDKVAPKGRENEKTLAHNAAFLAYEMPKLSRKTLQSVDSLQCGKFVRTKSEKSAAQLVSMAPALLACQNDFKNHAEHIQCLSMILFSDDLCKLFDRSCPGNQAQQPKQIDASLTTQTILPPAQRDNTPCTCTRTFSEKTHKLLEKNGINQAAFDSLTRVDPLVEQLTAHDDEANYLEAPVKGVLLSVQPKLGNTITKFLNRSLPVHDLRAVLYDNNYGHDLDLIAVVPQSSDLEYLALIKTQAPNYDLTNKDILEKYTQWQKKYKLSLDGAGQDWLAANIGATDIDWDALAREVYAFCPDVVDQGTGTVENLRDGMKKSRGLYLWWDKKTQRKQSQ